MADLRVSVMTCALVKALFLTSLVVDTDVDGADCVYLLDYSGTRSFVCKLGERASERSGGAGGEKIASLILTFVDLMMYRESYCVGPSQNCARSTARRRPS